MLTPLLLDAMNRPPIIILMLFFPIKHAMSSDAEGKSRQMATRQGGLHDFFNIT
jgi:hypothetical protein